MKYAITSHGGSLDGDDIHPLAHLTALIGYASATLPHDGAQAVVRLLAAPADAVTGETYTVPADHAARLAPLLARLSTTRYSTATRPLGATARLLADSAARAADTGEPWTWQIETGAS
ncbi:hypothetical protein ACN20G_36890 (plasmid) [Streptomyces sp. BI20]|uniref:DUF7739 domain-containing protein n=1 Tax=Streptomyces sp. BI20 TaxID=3403460 RepID=UPI003C739540